MPTLDSHHHGHLWAFNICLCLLWMWWDSPKWKQPHSMQIAHYDTSRCWRELCPRFSFSCFPANTLTIPKWLQKYGKCWCPIMNFLGNLLTWHWQCVTNATHQSPSLLALYELRQEVERVYTHSLSVICVLELSSLQNNIYSLDHQTLITNFIMCIW